jgi:hypothetical protein
MDGQQSIYGFAGSGAKVRWTFRKGQSQKHSEKTGNAAD